MASELPFMSMRSGETPMKLQVYGRTPITVGTMVGRRRKTKHTAKRLMGGWSRSRDLGRTDMNSAVVCVRMELRQFVGGQVPQLNMWTRMRGYAVGEGGIGH